MNKIALNILIATTILANNGCMTIDGVDYNPANNNTDKYVSIKERNFQIWLKNQNAIGGNKQFYTEVDCPSHMGHGFH
tara:strand:- start:121 stop:354 length:234 start_codon:yes stop_codon:yes gene_type:complete